MGQKTNPISNRIGITRGWDSNWCGDNYAEKIAEDYKIRKYLENRLAKAEYEMTFAPQFDHIVVNDNLETAKQQTLQLVSTFLGK